jgi:hypothetical protein
VNRERHRYWSVYIADVQRRMLLADWKVVLSGKPPEALKAWAAVERIPGQHLAYIHLSDGFDKLTRTEQRHSVVHELVHLHLAPVMFHIERQTGGADNDQWKAAIECAHITHEEYAVDDLARIIAPHMPLPSKGCKP